MSTNCTPNYNLCQWKPEDKVLRTDFNEDNAKIDAAIKAVNGRVDSLSGTVSGQTSLLGQKGNCQIYATSYVGKGTYGPSGACRLTFPAKPEFVMVMECNGVPLTMMRPCEMALSGDFNVTVSWSGNSVSWYHNNSASVQLNQSGSTYPVVAFLALS